MTPKSSNSCSISSCPIRDSNYLKRYFSQFPHGPDTSRITCVGVPDSQWVMNQGPEVSGIHLNIAADISSVTLHTAVRIISFTLSFTGT
jgi:hypothetical protein